MAKYVIDEEILKNLADAIRAKVGTSDKIYPADMATKVLEIEGVPNTIILVDENGNEYPAVLTEEEIDLTATANDIRLGSIAVTDDGVITGEKEIPSYHTYDGTRLVLKTRPLQVPHANYDYTKFQGIVCDFNTDQYDSVAATHVAINDAVYAVSSTVALAALTKNDTNRLVDFGITASTDKHCFIRYIMYKEIY